MSTDRDRLGDMVEYLAKIEEHRPATLDDLEQDELRTAAIVRWIEIVGEAASHVSEPIRDGHPEVPWREIVAMRNRLIHAYPGVNLALVWGVVEREAPGLRSSIEAILEEMS